MALQPNASQIPAQRVAINERSRIGVAPGRNADPPPPPVAAPSAVFSRIAPGLERARLPLNRPSHLGAQGEAEVLRLIAAPLQQLTGGRFDPAILRQLLIALAMIGIMLWRPRGLWPSPEHGQSPQGQRAP